MLPLIVLWMKRLGKLFQENSILSIEENSNPIVSKDRAIKSSIKIAVNA